MSNVPNNKRDYKSTSAACNILFIGTSHISPESVSQIKKAIDSFSPTIVCVELDRRRLGSLLKKQKPSYSPRLIFELGLGGYFFAVIGGLIQQKLGNFVGTTPGHDMLTAVQYSREKKASVALIDQPIDVTMRRISKEFGISVIFAMIGDFFSSIFFPERTKKKLGLENFSLSRAPTEAFVKSALHHLETRYPGLYAALLVERNIFMAERVNHLTVLNPDAKILVVVGAAHMPGMQELLRNNYKLASERLYV